MGAAVVRPTGPSPSVAPGSPPTLDGAEGAAVVLGATGLRVSPLGLGTVAFGLPYGVDRAPPPDESTCVRLLRRARDLGVRYFDTAAAYGRSDELLGRAFDGRGEGEVVIATKVSLRDGEGRTLRGRRLAEGVTDSVQRSLRRLRRQRLDVLQVHSADDGAFASQELLDLAAKLVDSGQVGHWGVSTYGRRAPLAAMEHPESFGVLQVAFSALDRTLEDGVVLPRCRQLGLGLVIRSVFLQGVLSERRRRLPPHLSALSEAADRVAQVADALGRPLAEVALRFALYEVGAHVTLVGAASQDELEADCRAAAAGPLPADAVAALRRVEVADEDLLNPATWTLTPSPGGPIRSCPPSPTEAGR